MTNTSKPASPGARLKMADIARLANVSVSTVSRALSGSELIPISMREKIASIAQEHGYVVNQAARNLRLQTTRTIGLVLPLGHDIDQEITDPFLLEIIGRLSQEVIRRGYDILLTKVTQANEGWLNELIQSNRFDGVLILGQSDQHDAINEISQRYLPMVVWGEHLPNQSYCTVGVDNVLGGRLATEHLLATGRKLIRFMGPQNVPESDSRYRGYCQALETANLATQDTDMVTCHFTHDSAAQAMRALLASKRPFDAIFAASDVIAHGAKRAFIEAGGNVPNDVAFCGFDDVAMAKYLSPPLTTIRQDLVVAARLMIDLLFRRMAGENAPSQNIDAELIIRASSAPRLKD